MKPFGSKVAFWGLFLLSYLAGVKAETTPSLSTVPACGTLCLVEMIEASTCSLTNQTCVCTNVELVNAITLCVAQNCTIREQLVVQKFSKDTCGAPVRNRIWLTPIIGSIFGAMALAAYMLRMVAKMTINGQIGTSGFGLEDISLSLAVILMVPFFIFSWLLAKAGLGRDIWEVPPNDITSVLYYYFWDELIYLTVLPLLKISFLLLYLRIFPDKNFRKVVLFVIALNVGYGIAFVCISIWQCRPLPGAWERWDGTFKGTCNDINVQGWTSAGINIALDAVTLSLPLFPLSKLKMARARKISVMLMFSLGFFVSIVSILRLNSLLHFAKTTNPTQDYVELGYWTNIEIYVGVICVCLPSIRPLVLKWFPSIGTEKGDSNATLALQSKSSKYSIKPSISHSFHRQLESRDHSSTHELVDFESKKRIGNEPSESMDV